MANQSYTGVVTAAYVNLSKKNKEYATGYIQLPDANGANQSYKFLIFDDTAVAALKAFGPDALKGKSVTMDGEFKENTWNGNTEYQLMAASLVLPEAAINPVSPENAPGTGAPQAAVPQAEVPPVVPTVPTVPEVPSVPTMSAPEVPTAPTAPTAPGAVPTIPTAPGA